MPANLPPQYHEMEKNLRTAKSAEEKIAIIEELLAIMPKHKGTDHLRAELRAKIAKLNLSMDKKSATQHTSLMIHKEGAAQVVIVGPPNAGKSQLVVATTNATPAVAPYPFTTKSPTPGMMPFENIQIQLVDTPPLTDQPEWWLTNIVRRADALLVMVDLGTAPLAQMETVLAQLKKMRVTLLGLPNSAGDQSVPMLPKKAIMVGNKIDLDIIGENLQMLQNAYANLVPVVGISATEGTGIDEFKRKTYQVLDIIRVYTKMPSGKPDLNDPVILNRGSTLEDAATAVHKSFAARLKYARIWGSGKHDGIMVKRDHILQEGDVIELHV